MDKDSISLPSIIYLELFFLVALILPPLVESVRVLCDSNSQLEYAKIMSGATNPSIFSIFIQGLFALAMFFRSKRHKFVIFKLILPYIFILGFLVLNSFFWNWIIQVQGGEVLKLQEITIQNLFLFIFATSIAAFYEEVLYRWYGPEILFLVFFKNIGEGTVHKLGTSKVKSVFVEALLVIVFALSHGYGGWEAVGNALIAGLALRLCALKTGSPLPGFFAHLSYNFIQFYLLLQ